RIIVGDVVEFPFVISERGHWSRAQEPWRLRGRCYGSPTLVVERTVTEHFEVLGHARRRRVRIRLVERVSHAHAFDRRLLDTVNVLGSGNSADFEDGRDDVDHVVKLGTNATGILDVGGP